jgi:hypothetical protein
VPLFHQVRIFKSGLRGIPNLPVRIFDNQVCVTLPDQVFSRPMSSLPTADLLALDIDGLKSRLSKLRRYL